ncbi:DUF3224 domain-containing protein [Marinihelvus fidelis]|uniref:DUF3224 domain-containing protein n=1 Tax=Marinihelvus fidelis TaxID=2613842 RepID=A0A5N0TAX9_9GAMM|nr:DUF3224 domain-containing protein [Marinihelvus fidelis]KAA9131828.1 DUF3224 domain-containing protein [Marinihelvus fidelis]
MPEVTGPFDVSLEPQPDPEAPAGRMIIRKRYSGAIEGTANGQMISHQVEGGVAIYFAIETFEGSVDGREGGFLLAHRGVMSADRRELDIHVIDGTGTGALEGISGRMDISQAGGEHHYTFDYTL